MYAVFIEYNAKWRHVFNIKTRVLWNLSLMEIPSKSSIHSTTADC